MSFLNEFKDYSFPNIGMVRLPEVNISSEEKKSLGLPISASNYQFLWELCLRGFEQRKHKLNPKRLHEYKERLKYELEMFEELGFTDYVLLVWMVINKVRELGHYVDAGRGSCVASFAFALLGITDILDVIDKGLIFERFISRVRSKKQVIDGVTYLKGDMIADADLNVGLAREEIVKWLGEKYKGKICKIAALSTLTGKILIKDVYKTINEVGEEEAKRVADLVEKHYGVVADIQDMVDGKRNSEGGWEITPNEEFKAWASKYPDTFKTALQLRNLLRQKTTHASGYFISYYDLDGFVPVELSREKELTLSYEMNDAAKFGTKLDLLGLTQNGILTEFFKDIKEKPEDIELEENPIVYDALQGDFLPYGLYQISADCALKVTRKIKPKNLLEVSDLNAIARPGALDYLDSYVDRTAKSPHPIFDKIVSKTRNLFLYQEQLMQALVAIGFTLDEAEICRKIVGKKQLDKVGEWEEKIKNKVKDNNLPPEISKIVWKVLEDSANYSFNMGHSLGVSKLGATTVWAKYKYPLQFYKACLNGTRSLPNPRDEIALIQKELVYFGIKLLPPHILKSQDKFIIEDNNIRFPLYGIKGISDKTIDKLRGFCQPYSNKFEIFSAAKECKLSIDVVSNIISCGAMDDFLTKDSRCHTILELSLYNLLTPKEQKRVIEVGSKFDFNLIEIIRSLSKVQENELRPFIKESRMGTLRKNFAPYNDIYKNNIEYEDFYNYWNERHLLGFSYSKSLVEILKRFYPNLDTIFDVKGLPSKSDVTVCGEVLSIKSGTSKNKQKYIRYEISDSTETISAMIMERNFEDNKILNSNSEIFIGDIIVAEGSTGDRIVFCDKIVNQKVKIITKVSALKNKEKEVDKTANLS